MVRRTRRTRIVYFGRPEEKKKKSKGWEDVCIYFRAISMMGVAGRREEEECDDDDDDDDEKEEEERRAWTSSPPPSTVRRTCGRRVARVVTRRRLLSIALIVASSTCARTCCVYQLGNFYRCLRTRMICVSIMVSISENVDCCRDEIAIKFKKVFVHDVARSTSLLRRSYVALLQMSTFYTLESISWCSHDN
jgi:hypothetical protein